MADETTKATTKPEPVMSEAEKFQAELNVLMAKYPTIKLIVDHKITITEKA